MRTDQDNVQLDGALVHEEGFVPDSDELYAALVSSVVWDERMKSRKTASFGAPYDYSGMTYAPVPIHPRLEAIVDLLERRFRFRPNNCLANYYPDGGSVMGFHSDSLANLEPGTGVAIVSLGAEREITFRSRRGPAVEHTVILRSGSLLYMPPAVQTDWRHAILKQEGAGGRISLTVRAVLAGTS